jgi:EAL domain-containing protein (putative c-di-GMP-specific phosphodiesterase class I)
MNVSTRQLTAPGWVGDVIAALAAHGADPHRLQIEIAENVVMGDPACVKAILDQLRAAGIALSIDNFGTGLSSLGAIKDFPLDTLKIDRSFIANIVTNSSDQAVAKTIIMLAHSLGLNVVAAGVETPAQINALRAYGSDAFQGYIASAPMAAAEFAEFLTRYASSAPPAPVVA